MLPPPDSSAAYVDSKTGTPTRDFYNWIRSLQGALGGSSQGQPIGFYIVTDFGADPTGVADSAPAFRACVGSDRIILVPPGTYLFKTQVVPAFLGMGITAVDVDQCDNFLILSYGATINIDPSIAPGSMFFFSRTTNFQVLGGTFNPDDTLVGGEFNPCFGAFSCQNFRFADIVCGEKLQYQAFFGDFLINGTFEHITVKHGQAIDMAYIKNIKFDDIQADGGGDTPAGLFAGIAGDTVSLGFNDTSVTIDESDGVSFTRCDVTGYATGCYIRQGKNYLFRGNHWHGLDHPSVSCAAILISYSTDPLTPSTGFPVQGVTINGDVFSNLGATTAGFAIWVDPTAIVSADVISGITVDDCVFKDINYLGIGAAATSNLADLVHGDGNVFSNVTTDIESNFRSISDVPLDVGSISISNTSPTTTPSVDFSSTATFAVANGGNTVIPNKHGLILLKDTNVVGDVGLYILAPGGGITFVAGGGLVKWVAPTSAPAAGKISVNWSGSDFRVYNNLGSSSNVRLLQISTG